MSNRRTVRKLSRLKIDEISLVDRPANQHGLVAIAKREEHDMPGLFLGDGTQIDEDELEHGDVVYDDAGEEYVYVEGDTDDGVDPNTADVYDGSEYEGEMVGKTLRPLSGAKVTAAVRLGRMRGKQALDWANKTGKDVAGHVDRNRGSYGLGAGLGAGAGGGYAVGNHGKVGKSYGDTVLTALSKAFTEQDRDQVVAKFADELEEVAKRNDQLENIVAQLVEQQEAGQYVELAKGYDIPGTAEGIGGLLYRASQVLPEEDVAALDRLFSSISEVGKADRGFYEQLGFDGSVEPDVLDQVMSAAGEIVTKADGSLSQEAAMTALFSANPAAYDEYEAEQRRGR